MVSRIERQESFMISFIVNKLRWRGREVRSELLL